jgi:hypothetical protein
MDDAQLGGRGLRIVWRQELDRVPSDRSADAVVFDRQVVGDSLALIDRARARGFAPFSSAEGKFESWGARRPPQTVAQLTFFSSFNNRDSRNNGLR